MLLKWIKSLLDTLTINIICVAVGMYIFEFRLASVALAFFGHLVLCSPHYDIWYVSNMPNEQNIGEITSISCLPWGSYP